MSEDTLFFFGIVYDILALVSQREKGVYKMKRCAVWLLGLTVMLGTIGCNSNSDSQVSDEGTEMSETSTPNEESNCETKVDDYTSVADIDKLSDGYVDVYYQGDKNIYRAYFSESEKKIAVEHSTNAGADWERTLVEYADYGYGVYKVFLSFVNELEGYLLYCGEPGAGLMNEVLYKTTDGGKSYEVVADISLAICDYPTGMEFLSENVGFIITSYHGNDAFLYKTTDGGKTWKEQSITLPDISYSYAQGYSIEWNDEKQLELVVELVEIEGKTRHRYYTKNGINWILKWF